MLQAVGTRVALLHRACHKERKLFRGGVKYLLTRSGWRVKIATMKGDAMKQRYTLNGGESVYAVKRVVVRHVGAHNHLSGPRYTSVESGCYCDRDSTEALESQLNGSWYRFENGRGR